MAAGNTLIQSITASATDIAQWWATACLVVGTNSRPRQEKISGGRHISESRPPFDLAALDRLDEAENWTRLCATACGRKWQDVLNTETNENAEYIITHSNNLINLPDLDRWAADGRHAAYGIQKILGANDHTIIRAALLVARMIWKPEYIAFMLTDILGQSITADAVSKAKHDGRITVADDGTVSLEECLIALIHSGQA